MEYLEEINLLRDVFPSILNMVVDLDVLEDFEASAQKSANV